MLKKTPIALLFVFTLTLIASAQANKSLRPSPPAQAQCKLPDGKTITVDYSSPRMNGRKIYGGLVPYGQVWRLGANEATTFDTTAPLTVDGKDVPAGNYTLFTIPAEQQWTLIINKKTGEWGIPYKYEADELFRVPMNVSKTDGTVQNFTISFDQSGDACTMRASWENTEASIKFTEKK